MSEQENTNIFVTGGTGLIGSHVLFNLSEKYKIIALTRSLSKPNKLKALFQFYDAENYQKRLDNIEWIQGDLSDIPLLDNCIERSSYVVHAAGLVSFYKRDFNKLLKINFEGTSNIVNVCLAKNIKKLVHISSVSVLGKTIDGAAITEKIKWKNSPDNSGYATSKYLGEREAWRGAEEGLDTIILNPSIVLGPGELNESSSKLFRSVFKGYNYFTSGANSFVDVRDVANSVSHFIFSEIKNESFIISSEDLSYQELFTKIAQTSNKKVPAKEVSKFTVNFFYNIELFLRVFGRKTIITKENKKSMFSKHKFDGSKILKTTDFKYVGVDLGIENAVAFYKSENLV